MEALKTLRSDHNAVIQHRDIKPQNILFKRDSYGGYSRFILADFGLAKAVDKDEDEVSITGGVGTPPYMDPLNDKCYDGADMWSLAVMTFKCLCRRYPFGNPTNDPFEYKKNAAGCIWEFEKEEKDTLSAEAMDFIT